MVCSYHMMCCHLAMSILNLLYMEQNGSPLQSLR